MKLGGALALTIGLFAGQSEAAIFEYSYTGPPIDVPDRCFAVCPAPLSEDDLIRGKFVIDEALIPTGSVRNTRFIFERDFFGTAPYRQYRWEVVTLGRTVSGFFDESVRSFPDWSVVGVTSWDYPFLHSSLGLRSYFEFTTDDRGAIIDWGGASQEGGFDMSSDTFYDTSPELRSKGPGVWSKTVLVADPAPVPLPAAGSLMVVALSGLYLGARLRRLG